MKTHKEFISKLTRARENFWLFFQTFEWIFLQNVRKPSIFEWHLSPSWPTRSAKENFWLFFQTFEWIFPQNVNLNDIYHQIKPHEAGKKIFDCFFNTLSEFASKCGKIPYLNMEFISKLTCAKRERIFLTFFKLLSGFSFKMLGTLYIWMTFTSKLTRAKENIWLFFQTFAWIFPQNVNLNDIYHPVSYTHLTLPTIYSV